MESSDYVTDDELVRTASKLTRLFSRQCRLSFHDQDDLNQDFCIALLKARERFDPEIASWKTYSYEVVRYELKNFLRSNKIHGTEWNRNTQEATQIISLDKTYEDDTPIIEPSIEDEYGHLYYNEFLQYLKRPRDRFIVLCLLGGWNLADISRTLGITQANLSRHMSRLRIESYKFLISPLMGTRLERSAMNCT